MTGPSAVFSRALTQQADAQEGSMQCMHWVFAKRSSPWGELFFARLTTVKVSGPVARRAANTLSSPGETGSGSLFASLQAASQPRHPTHSVVSTRTPTAPGRGVAEARAVRDFTPRLAAPATPAILKRVLRLSFIVTP